MEARASSGAPARERPRYEDDPSPQLLALLRQAFPTFAPTPINWCRVEWAIKDVHHANHQGQHDAFFRDYFELTAAGLINFMRADGMLPPAEAEPAKKKKPFRNLRECLLALMKGGGRERIRDCGTLQALCDFIHEIHPDQPATPQLLKGRGVWPGEDVAGMKWQWGKVTRKRGRTVAVVSRLGENLDLDSFEGRRPALPSRYVVSAPLHCASCREVITEPPMQKDGKVYCQPCGREKFYDEIPAP